MALTKQDITNVMDQKEVVWYSHTDKVSTFPKLPDVFRFIGLSFSRLFDQLDRVESNQRKIMAKLGVE